MTVRIPLVIRIRAIAAGLLAIALIFLWCGQAGRFVTALDIANLFWGAAVTIGVVAFLLWALIRPRPTLSRTGIAALLLAGGSVRPAESAPGDCLPGQQGFKIVSANLWSENAHSDAAIRWIEAERPDVVVLLEAKGRASRVPQQLSPLYPYAVDCHPRVRCSTMILSRHRPLQVLAFGRNDPENRSGLSAAAMTLPLDGRTITVAGVHLSRPWPAGRQEHEVEYLSDLLLATARPPYVVAGDFNAAPPMFLFQNLTSRLGVRRASLVKPSWPVRASFGPLPAVLAIDHLFISPGLGVESIYGRDIGSDHYPLVAKICGSSTPSADEQTAS